MSDVTSPAVSLVLASASPARLATLHRAGVEPIVVVSDVDEQAVLRDAVRRYGQLDPVDAVLLLARAKAESVAATEPVAGLVLGCDSLLEVAGVGLGKPADAQEATAWWRDLRGRSAVLHTGHWLVDTRPVDNAGTGGSLGATASAVVHFADVSDAEIATYVATGEPMRVAGGFAIDGLGAPFVVGIEGDHHTVVGLSVPLLRSLLRDLGLGWYDIVARRR